METPSLDLALKPTYYCAMQPKDTVNPVQASIIRQLFFHDKRRFAKLNVDKIPSDQLSYHLRQLVKYGIVEKHADATYSLTVSGRTRAIMLYPDKSTFVQQGFLAVRLVITKREGRRRFILMQQRTAVPYKNKFATPGEKIMFGEDVLYAAGQALRTQTGLGGDLTLKGVHHLKDVYQRDIVQDKYFFVCTVVNPHGELNPAGRSGLNMWLPLDEVATSTELVHGCWELINPTLNSSGLSFHEKTYKVTNY